jgi:hypothetical protein
MIATQNPTNAVDAPAAGDDYVRHQAVKQIERRRRFHVAFAVPVIGIVLQLTLTERGTIPIHDWKGRIPS